ncbi:MAG: tRNA threonylcarbamoyladenosine dehydratase [Alphaproteobacteria bacterium]|nr:tRNA threonylcarbamoyladenosine dehydratase [Alphaproteobacteria bacterium]
MDRLHRTRLMFGDRGLERLHNATVMVVGCGAVGSFAIEALARSGIGTIVIVDFDNVDTTNINRQLFALDSTVGRPKVDVATSRIHDINPTTTVRAYNLFWDRDTDLDEKPDFVIDAIDSVESKIALARWASDRKIPIISSMGAALKTDITQIQVASLFHTRVCPLASRVRRLARSAQLPDWPVVYSTQPPLPTSGHAKNMGSLITVTGTFGLMLAGYVIEELVK